MSRGKSGFFRLGQAVLTIALLPIPAWADNHHSPPLVFVEPLPYASTVQQCPPTNITICNQVVMAPGAAANYVANLNVPSPYIHQPFSAICTSAGYQVGDVSNVTCTLLTCQPSSVAVCNASIPVPDTLTIGGSTTVPVPVAALADPSTASPNLNFTARCVDDGNGGAMYQAADTSHISCNLFPCADATVQLCGMALSVRGGTPMGGVQTLSMPPPFAPDTFTVQCVGSEGKPAVYQLSDVSAVTCQTRTPAP